MQRIEAARSLVIYAGTIALDYFNKGNIEVIDKAIGLNDFIQKQMLLLVR